MSDTSNEAIEALCTDLLKLDVAYKFPTCEEAAHALSALAAERDALRAENERLREYGQAVVDEYPVSAGTSSGLCGDESGYGSIYRLCTALNAKTPPG